MILALLVAGTVAQVGSPTLTIDGDGYFRMAHEGRIVYAKSAKWIITNGRVEEANGAVAMPLMEAPTGATAVSVDQDGTVWITTKGSKKEVGQLMLAVFAKADALQPQGSYLTAKSRPTLHTPGDGKAGLIQPSGSVAEGSRNPAQSTRIEPKATGKLVIVAPESAQSKGARIILEDVVTFTGTAPESVRKLDLGPAPTAGAPLRYQTSRLRGRLKTLGFVDGTFDIEGSDVIVIEASGQIVSSDQFLAAAREATGLASEVTATLEPDAVIEAFTAPAGKLELKLENKLSGKESMTIRLGIHVDGRRVNSKSITLIGSALAVAVKAGDAVKVRLAVQGIAVEVVGFAKKDARIGELVEVTTQIGDAASKTTHIARVIGAGIVEVKLP